MDILVNKILFKNYPLKIKFDKINNLSHFYILSNNWNKYMPFEFNISGKILNGEYINWKIIQVVIGANRAEYFTNKILDWNKYLLFYVSFLNKIYNPCINENNFLILLHTYNFINELNSKNIIITKNNNIKNITIYYLPKPNNNLLWNNNNNNKLIINKENHFYFNSFNVNQNYKQIKNELDRLIKFRDKYTSIHFHLDNNVGGDIIPAHIILRCLIGKKEMWMKNIKKILLNKEILEWNCWKEEDINSPNRKLVNKINLKILPNYETKYNGKIYLYMNKQNSSAVWFFITYIIYGFNEKINRYKKNCYGQIIKYGSITSNQLKLIGHSGTTSGDGNSIKIKYKNINIICPTEQFLSCSIKKYDWNRFWIE